MHRIGKILHLCFIKTKQMTSTKYQFKAARVLAGLTQRELSEKSGVSLTTIVKIDNGVYNDLTPLKKIAKVLNKKVNVILN